MPIHTSQWKNAHHLYNDEVGLPFDTVICEGQDTDVWQAHSQ